MGSGTRASVVARAGARVGLLGNPSDIYGGRGIGFALARPGVRVRLAESGPRGLGVEPSSAAPLVEAGWQVFRERASARGRAPELGLRLEVECDVPFQSGLSGSSAILAAALVALAARCELALEPRELAELCWLAETRELGILAGPLDRLVQAHGGLVWMDFARPFEDGAVEALDPSLLPPMLVAWHAEPGAPSGAVHEPVFERWRAGDPAVREVMGELASVADRGRVALERGEHGELCDLLDRNFDLRASLFTIGEADRRLVELGRAAGAAAKFCGSGGSVLAVPRDPARLNELAERYRTAGCVVLDPEVGRGARAEAP